MSIVLGFIINKKIMFDLQSMDYKQVLNSIKEKIKYSRVKAYRKVNSELVILYFEL